MKLSLVIDELVEERGLDRAELSSIICEGILAAYTKKYSDIPLRVEHNKKTDEVEVLVEKKVVPAVEDEDVEISIRKAKFVNKDLNVGDTVWLPFEGPIGRVEIMRAKQIIATKIRKIEADIVFNAFKDKEGAIVNGVIHKCENGGAVVKVQDTFAFLPRSLTIPGDKCIIGYPIRALLKEVLPEPQHENQLILDRTSDQFLRKLFELEVPEVFERLVEIKKIVRIPGYKSKVVVVSHDDNIDPVGTCVGVGGVRIRPILRELGGEKIDVIAWGESLEQMVKGALKPAVVNRVQVVDAANVNVWVAEDQRSAAIGRMGQNIALASRLAGVNIHLMQEEPRATNQEAAHASDDAEDTADLD